MCIKYTLETSSLKQLSYKKYTLPRYILEFLQEMASGGLKMGGEVEARGGN